MRQREIISFSLPADRAKALKQAVNQSGMSLSEFLRDAISRKLLANDWKKIRRKGAQTAKKYKISPEGIEKIVDEFRE